jgi:hypothetical protein
MLAVNLRRLFAVVIVPVVLLASPTSACSGDNEQFDLGTAKAEWAKVRALAASVSGTGRSQLKYIVRPSPDMLDSESFIEVKQNRDCVSIQRNGLTLSRSKEADYVTGVNPKYAFQIKRPIGTTDWIIDQIDIGGDGSQLSLAFGVPLRQTAQREVCSHLFVWDRRNSLDDLFERPNFRTTHVGPVMVDGVEMVRVDFECPYPVEKMKDPGFSPVQGGQVVLDPKHYWCIKEYMVRTDDSTSVRKFSKKFDYVEGRERFPILRGSRSKQEGYKPDGTHWFTTETEAACEFRQSDDEYEDRAFTLSAYGLPEPHGITWKRPTPRYIYLLIAAGAFALLGLGLRYLAQRRLSSRQAAGEGS